MAYTMMKRWPSEKNENIRLFQRLDNIQQGNSAYHQLYEVEQSQDPSNVASTSANPFSDSSNTASRTTVPRLSIDLNPQKGNEQCVFQRGDKVQGHLYVDTQGNTDTTIRVINLRVAVYGHACVHGDQRDQPFRNALFDCKKDVKLISTGIRIIRRHRQSAYNSGMHSQQQPASAAFHHSTSIVLDNAYGCTETIVHFRSGKAEEKTVVKAKSVTACDFVADTGDGLDRRRWKLHTDTKIKEQKSKIIEKLLETVSSAAYTSGSATLNRVEDGQDEDRLYLLDNDSVHRIRFSISIESRRSLPGSFNHPNYPIQYYIVALLIYSTNQDPAARHLAFAKLPLSFAPSPVPHCGFQRTNPTYLAITNGKFARLLSTVQRRVTSSRRPHRAARVGPFIEKSMSTQKLIDGTSSSSSSSTSISWVDRLVHQLSQRYSQQKRRRQQKRRQHLACSLELPWRTLTHGEQVPLRVHLTNQGVEIHQITVRAKMMRRIFMTCSTGEVVESIVLLDTSVTLTGEEAAQISYEPEEEADGVSWLSAAEDSALDLVEELSNQKKSALSIILDEPPQGTYDIKSSSVFSLMARELVLDLRDVLQVPQSCGYSVSPEMTRGTFEIAYEMDVKVYVQGRKKIDSILQYEQDKGASSCVLFATKQQTDDVPTTTTKTENGAYKAFVLRPSRIPIWIGCESIKSA